MNAGTHIFTWRLPSIQSDLSETHGSPHSQPRHFLANKITLRNKWFYFIYSYLFTLFLAGLQQQYIYIYIYTVVHTHTPHIYSLLASFLDNWQSYVHPPSSSGPLQKPGSLSVLHSILSWAYTVRFQPVFDRAEFWLCLAVYGGSEGRLPAPEHLSDKFVRNFSLWT